MAESGDKRKINGPDAEPVRVLTDRERFDAAIDRIKDKHIEQYHNIRGYIKRTAWRIRVSYGHLNNCICGAPFDSGLLDKVLDFSALDRPFSYDEFAHWEPISTVPKDNKVILVRDVRDNSSEVKEVHWVCPNFRITKAPYQIVDVSKFLCWRYRDVRREPK